MSDGPFRSPLYARVPDNVLFDPELTLSDLRVYGAMAIQCRKTNLVHIGQRLLADLAHVDRRTLRRSLENLGRRGHISRAIPMLSRRAVYQLNSPVFLATIDLPTHGSLGAAQRPLLGASERPRYRTEKTPLKRVK
jgi:hypothetical protein